MKFCKERTDAICDKIRRGCTFVVAAESCGISAKTFYQWLKEGQSDPEGEKGEFCNAVTRAKADAEEHYTGLLEEHAKTDPKSVQFFLERRNPREWGRRDRLDLQISQQARALVEALEIKPEDFDDAE